MIELVSTWGGWLLAFVATVFAVKTTIRFDLNDWLKERRNRRKEQLRSLCTHVDITQKGEDFEVRSTFVSPFGTTASQCQSCRHVTHDRAWIEENTMYWAQHPDEWVERMKQIDKLTEKYLGS